MSGESTVWIVATGKCWPLSQQKEIYKCLRYIFCDSFARKLKAMTEWRAAASIQIYQFSLDAGAQQSCQIDFHFELFFFICCQYNIKFLSCLFLTFCL